LCGWPLTEKMQLPKEKAKRHFNKKKKVQARKRCAPVQTSVGRGGLGGREKLEITLRKRCVDEKGDSEFHSPGRRDQKDGDDTRGQNELLAGSAY